MWYVCIVYWIGSDPQYSGNNDLVMSLKQLIGSIHCQDGDRGSGHHIFNDIGHIFTQTKYQGCLH